MYLNLSKFLKSDLVPEDILYLTAIKQNAAGKNVEFLSTYLTDSKVAEYENQDFIKTVKGKKTDSTYFLLRTTDKANKLLAELSYAADVDGETEVLFNWLQSVYKSKPNGIIKNKIETKRRIQWFKSITGISGNYLALLLAEFISDSFVPENDEKFIDFKKQNPRAVLSNMLDNICWTPRNDRSVHYTLEDSPLYNYYQDNLEHINKVWAEKIKQ